MFASKFQAVSCLVQDWMCSLHMMYDVAIMREFAEKVRDRSIMGNAVAMHNAWFGDALFFIAHQLRFSSLVRTFATDIVSASDLWSLAGNLAGGAGHHDALERALKQLWRETAFCNLQDVWRAVRPGHNSNHWDPTFRAETEGIPPLVRRQLGLYAYGVASWDFDNVDLLNIGKTLARTDALEAISTEADQQRHVAMVKKDLLLLMPPLLSDYTVIHKIRTRLRCKCDVARLQGWFFGHAMSEDNSEHWTLLGEPTVAAFKEKYLGRDCCDLDCGFHLCGNGGLAARVDCGALLRIDVQAVSKLLADSMRARGVSPSHLNQGWRFHLPHGIYKFALRLKKQAAQRREEEDQRHEEVENVDQDEEEDRGEGNCKGEGVQEEDEGQDEEKDRDEEHEEGEEVQDGDEDDDEEKGQREEAKKREVAAPMAKKPRLNSLKLAGPASRGSNFVPHQLQWPDGTSPPAFPKGWSSMRIECKNCKRGCLGRSYKTLERDPLSCLQRPESASEARLRSRGLLRRGLRGVSA